MAKISELTDAQIAQQIIVFKNKVAAGDEGQKKILMALLAEKKKRDAANPVEEPEALGIQDDEEEAAEASPKKKSKKIGGGAKSKSGRMKKVGAKGPSKKGGPAAKGKAPRKGGSKDKPAKAAAKASPEGDKTAIGKLRKPLMVILFSIITFGIYAIVWQFKIIGEMKKYRGQGISPVMYLILSLVPLLNFASIIFPFLIPAYIGRMHEEDEQERPISGLAGLWIFLPFVGPFIWVAKVQGNLNSFWESKGAEWPSKDDEEDDDEEDDDDFEEDED